MLPPLRGRGILIQFGHRCCMGWHQLAGVSLLHLGTEYYSFMFIPTSCSSTDSTSMEKKFNLINNTRLYVLIFFIACIKRF
jgi:hypothetical protein